MEISQLSSLRSIAQQASGHAPSPSRLPALRTLLSTEPNPGAVRSVLITHVLHTAVEYVELVNKTYPVAGVVAVPYSADGQAIDELRGKGFDVVLPASVPDTFVKAREVTINALGVSEAPLVVQEVGGYLAQHTDELSSFAHFRGIVEDTNNGHWLYERHAPHTCPVLSMAQSPLKDVEDTIIGDAVVFSVERVLRENFAAILQGARCGVIGFGKIGTSAAIALKGREGVVSVYDINPAKDMRAKVEGFFPLPLHDLLARSELVIGCTGQTSVRLIDMQQIRDGAVMASASSKTVEFALEEFKEHCASVEVIDDVVTKFTRKNGKTFFVLYDGAPINFRDKSILGTILDMIYCELFVCMREVANGKVKRDLHRSPPAVQNEIAKAWLGKHSRVFTKYKDEKVWDYPKSLDLGLPQD